MLTKSEKEQVVGELEEHFKKQRVSIFAIFSGITVKNLSAFRRELRTVGAEFMIAKKTLLKRAMDAVGIGLDPKSLEGEIGVIFGYEDQAAPAKIAAKFGKAEKTFKILAGILDGKVIAAQGVVALARLPGREEMLGQVARAFQAPIRGLAVVLSANIRNLAYALNQVASKKS